MNNGTEDDDDEGKETDSDDNNDDDVEEVKDTEEFALLNADGEITHIQFYHGVLTL